MNGSGGFTQTIDWLAFTLPKAEVADVITKGQRVLPKASLDAGYRFRFTDVDTALKEILG